MNAPRRLLDRAYSNQRRLELRIPGADHAEFQAGQERTVSAFERPEALLEVQARMAAQLQKRPDDPSLLDFSGEASLLTWSYDSAITSLQQALNSDSRSPELLNDLATGYFERGEAEHRFEDYGLAFELESQALQAEPRNPVFLFNRAITGERLFLFKQCFEDWENYLRIDPSGSWSEEARNRLASARDRFESHQGRTRTPLLSEEAFSKKIDPFDQATWMPAEARIDQYLDLALTAWMPDAFPSDKGAPKSLAAKNALAALAAILRKKHNDSWLQDLLSESAIHNIGNPVTVLSQAMTADNITEDFALGSQKSIEATRRFTQQGNLPGALRARFEEIYALHFSDAGGKCLHAISALRPELSKKPYSWLNIQLQLEEKICLVDEDVLGASSDIAQNAVEAALEAHYPKLHLRALGFLGDAERLEGKKLAAWRHSREALQEYWAGSTDDVSGYNNLHPTRRSRGSRRALALRCGCGSPGPRAGPILS